MKTKVQYKVNIVDIDNLKIEKYTSIVNISTLSNFKFTENGILAVKFYGVGQGKLALINFLSVSKKSTLLH